MDPKLIEEWTKDYKTKYKIEGEIEHNRFIKNILQFAYDQTDTDKEIFIEYLDKRKSFIKNKSEILCKYINHLFAGDKNIEECKKIFKQYTNRKNDQERKKIVVDLKLYIEKQKNIDEREKTLTKTTKNFEDMTEEFERLCKEVAILKNEREIMKKKFKLKIEVINEYDVALQLEKLKVVQMGEKVECMEKQSEQQLNQFTEILATKNELLATKNELLLANKNELLVTKNELLVTKNELLLANKNELLLATKCSNKCSKNE
jgi:hypothetical protein